MMRAAIPSGWCRALGNYPAPGLAPVLVRSRAILRLVETTRPNAKARASITLPWWSAWARRDRPLFHAAGQE